MERLDEAIQKLRPGAAGWLAAGRQRRQLLFPNRHRRISLPAGRPRGVSGTGSRVGQGAGGLVGLGCWSVEPAGGDLAGERLALVHAHVGVGHERGEVVGVRRRRSRRRRPSGTAGRSGGRSARRPAAVGAGASPSPGPRSRPRAERTVSQPPCVMPCSAASSGLSSTNISGCSSLSQLLNRLIGPLR